MDMDPKGFPRGSYEALLDDSSQLSIALDTMAVTLGMDRALTDACKADALATHELGLSATDKLTPQLIEEMLFLARDLPPRYKELREGNVWERYENFSRSHLSRKKQRQYQKRLSNSKRLLDNHTESLESYATRERLGMFDSTTLDYIYFLDNIHYFFEPRPEEDYPLREDIVDQKDLQPLFSEDELTENVTMEQLAKKLVEMGKIDISPETLDARFGQLTKVAQIEMLYAMLDVLDNISRRGGKKKAFTMNFLETHHETTQRDDLWGMLEMMRQLANTCRQYGMAEKSSLLMSMANFMKRYADDIAYIIGQYKEAYLAFGYDLPEVIKSTPADTRPSLGRRAVPNW